MLDEQTWEERYRSRGAVWTGRANSQLVREAGGLAAGTAVDAACGEGGDAIWLAEHGWQVTAVDFSATALARGAAQAQTLGPDVAGRIRWVHADLVGWDGEGERFGLVSAHYIQLPAALREPVFARLAGLVAPGGTLLIVGHHPSDLATTVPRPPMPELFYTAEELAAGLDPAQWDVAAAQARPRTAADPEGREVTIHDAVLVARRRG